MLVSCDYIASPRIIIMCAFRGVATGGGVTPQNWKKPGKFGQTKGCLWLLAHPIKFWQFYKNRRFN